MTVCRSRGGWRLVAVVAAFVGVGCGPRPSGAPLDVSAAPTVVGYQLDASFDGDGVLSFPGWTDVRGIVPVANGGIIVELARPDPQGGTASQRAVARLGANGELDAAFGDAATPGIVELGAPFGSLLVRADGRFLIGSRQYLANGLPDRTFGTGGYLGNPPSTYSGVAQIVETASGTLVGLQPYTGNGGCGLAAITDQGGVAGVTILDAAAHCGGPASAAQAPDGSTLVMLDDVNDGLTLIRVQPDGSLDTSFGHGTSIVSVGNDRFGYTLRPTLQFMPDGALLLGLGEQRQLWKISLDGLPDQSWADGQGGTVLQADVVGAAVDTAGAITVTMSDSGTPHTGAYHPTLLRLAASGGGDANFNFLGSPPGQIDLTGLGLPASTWTSASAAADDGTLFVGYTAQRPPSNLEATIVALSPQRSPAQPVPSTSGPPATAPTIDGPASGNQPATRLGPVPG